MSEALKDERFWQVGRSGQGVEGRLSVQSKGARGPEKNLGSVDPPQLWGPLFPGLVNSNALSTRNRQ